MISFGTPLIKSCLHPTNKFTMLRAAAPMMSGAQLMLGSRLYAVPTVTPVLRAPLHTLGFFTRLSPSPSFPPTPMIFPPCRFFSKRRKPPPRATPAADPSTPSKPKFAAAAAGQSQQPSGRKPLEADQSQQRFGRNPLDLLESPGRERVVTSTPFVFGEMMEKIMPAPRPYEESFGYKLESWVNSQKQYWNFSPFWSKVLRHLMLFGAACLFSAWLAAAFAMGGGNAVPVLLENFDEMMALLYEDDSMKSLENALEMVADASWVNDTLKNKIIANPSDVQRVCHLATSTHYNINIRNYAVKILDNLTQVPANAVFFVEKGYHKVLIDLIRTDGTPLYVTKTASYTLCNIADDAANHIQLVQDGALEALTKVNGNPYTERQITNIAMKRIAHTYQQSGSELSVPPSTWRLAQTYAAEWKQDTSTTMYTIKNAIFESGSVLYIHTVIGGGVWGAITSIKNKAPARVFATNVLRTAFVTGVIPAYFVGACVSMFRNNHRQMDTYNELFNLYFATAVGTLYPWFHLLPIVERWAPLWLGGHVVGFISFFSYLRISDADILKSDMQLKIRDSEALKQQQQQK